VDKLAFKVESFTPVCLTGVTTFFVLIFPNGDTLYGVVLARLDDR
jgi:hypothetical protein